MFPESEKRQITNIQVRMDCNGCVQKIKKALHGINGIYDLNIDFPRQKITIIGWADPDKIIKAIKKTRKSATICLQTKPTEPPPSQPTEPPLEGGAPPTKATNPSPTDEASPAEPPNDPPPPPPAEQQKDPQPTEAPPPPEEKTLPPPPDAGDSQLQQPSVGPKKVEKVHTIYLHKPDYGNRYGYDQSYEGHRNAHPNGPGFRSEPPQPIYVTHSYNTYKPSPYITQYEYMHSPPRYTSYSRADHYNQDYCSGNITSIFSDENPNACTIT